MPIALIASLFVTFTSQAAEMDPNGFFQDKTWNVKVDEQKNILAESKYLGEPVQRPNLVTANLVCAKGETVEAFQKKYCGINYMKMVGGKLEVMFLDYNSADSRGYCTKKKIKHFDLPKCPKKLKK